MLTRCPQCATTFRVTPEQLKARLGRVRCGQCQTVFNALDSLVEETVAPQATPSAPTPQPLAEPLIENLAPPDEPEAAQVEDSANLPELSQEPAAEEAGEEAPEPPLEAAPDTTSVEATSEAAPEDQPVETGAAADSETSRQEPFIPEPHYAAPEAHSEPFIESILEPLPEPEPEPTPPPPETFVPIETTSLEGIIHRRLPPLTMPEAAEPEETQDNAEPPYEAPAVSAPLRPDPLLHYPPRRPPLIWPWIVATVLASLLAILQLALHYRVELAVLSPGLKPALQAACRPFGCDVPLPHKIDLLSIETSDLHPGKQKGRLQLNALLKNKAPFVQELPVLEIALTDVADRPLIVKALKPTDYLPPEQKSEQGFPARGEINVKLNFDAGDTPAVGYRLYLYYP